MCTLVSGRSFDLPVFYSFCNNRNRIIPTIARICLVIYYLMKIRRNPKLTAIARICLVLSTL
jgi:hypothetical protein